jgi:Putative peptidoglycan binding domain
MPRRRGAAAAAMQTTEQRNLAIRILLYSPKDLIAGVVAFAAVSAIIANAMLMQAGHHPSPMFGMAVPLASVPLHPLPRPRPLEAAMRPADVKLGDIRPAELKPVAAAPSAAKTASPTTARPPAATPVSSRGDPVAELIIATRRVAAVQRALTEYGYGQLKPTGTVGSDTLAAIQKFERERKLPVTGQVSDRLMRELSAVTGRAID